jgi:hypothetical protein
MTKQLYVTCTVAGLVWCPGKKVSEKFATNSMEEDRNDDNV